ncbi:MAG: hypothetical protein JXR22_12380, partial [Prolixibacteraceae bacterium]|nr:hypothetical protein [Prolixibacteraceae bacterium]
MSAIAAQYETSGHAAGTNVAYAGGRNTCAACHSHEGFVETKHTGRDTTATAIAIPTRVDCKTCHDGHVSFDTVDGPDYALRAKSAVPLLMFKKEKSVDFGGSSNLCANCHQPRTAAPVANADGEFRISSTHYGPHHGPQASYLQGVGAYEVAGSTAYPAEGSSAHSASGACVACHMNEANENGGGHTFAANVAGCTSCHTSATTLDINGIQTEVHGLLEDLAAILKSKGVLDDEGHVIPGTYAVDLAGAYYNYIGIEEDRSLGVHNPAYIKAVLKNT